MFEPGTRRRKRLLNAPHRHSWFVGAMAGGMVVLVGLGGCAATSDRNKTMTALASKVQALEYQLLATQVAITELSGEQIATQETLAEQLTNLNDELGSIPATITAICSTPTTTVTTQCDTDQPIQTVVMSGDKMVVGELERVWIDPPGVTLIARVDTGAHSSSLHAENLVEFERDGDDWVRFDLILDDEVTSLERPVARYVRVYQQADPDGTRRPVVAMRLRLGDVQETFQFTLADRSHLDFQMLLGRNFLTDMALVDVGKQFVQPQFKSNRD
jgi:hypothetical protein